MTHCSDVLESCVCPDRPGPTGCGSRCPEPDPIDDERLADWRIPGRGRTAACCGPTPSQPGRGAATGGTSGNLGVPVTGTVLRCCQELADVIVVGAGTARPRIPAPR